jgi:hypothetical protein
VNLSGRADAYLFNVANALKDREFKKFVVEQAQVYKN